MQLDELVGILAVFTVPIQIDGIVTIRACIVRVHRVGADIEFTDDDRVRCLSSNGDSRQQAEQKKACDKPCTSLHVVNRYRAPYDGDVTLLHLERVCAMSFRCHPE